MRPAIFGLPRFVIVIGIPVVAFIAALGIAFGLGGGSDDESAASAPPATVALTISE